MATMTITIPDGILQSVLDALSLKWGYDPDSGLTKAQFVKQEIRDRLELEYRRAKRLEHEDTFVAPADPGIDVT